MCKSKITREEALENTKPGGAQGEKQGMVLQQVYSFSGGSRLAEIKKVSCLFV